MIKNTSSKKRLTHNKRMCTTRFSQMLGLMFSPRIRDISLVFVFDREKNLSFHMLFVFFPIDIIFLDKSRKVVSMQNAMPFTPLIRSKKPAKYVLECPSGTIRKSRTKIGHQITF
ncbi:MAG: DUF192 domain-containing protein [Candidatus Woesearchaeota archaeon]